MHSYILSDPWVRISSAEQLFISKRYCIAYSLGHEKSPVSGYHAQQFLH